MRDAIRCTGRWFARHALLRRCGTAGLFAAALGAQPAGAVQGPEVLQALQRPDTSTLSYSDALAAFYAERGGRPLWFGSAHLGPSATALRAALAAAGNEGLSPGDYLTPTLVAACAGAVPADPAGCELQLSDALLRYAGDVGYGVLHAADVDPNWHIPQQLLNGRRLLERVAAAPDLPDLLRQLPPAHPGYRALRDALRRYRAWAAAGRWLAVPDGPSLHPGDHDDRVGALRERLGAASPELLRSDTPALFDPALEAAVRGFQEHHGLDPDGIVGRRTLAALNIPPEQRLTQLRANMERWRWLPRELGDSYILVNLAGFELTLVQPGQPPLQLRVINGRQDSSSPAFASRISRVLLNPDWTVPRRIAVEEMLPQLQRDPLALQDKDIQVLRRVNGELVPVDPASVDWRSLNKNNFPFVLRQAPGPKNSLGRIKFVMPNPFAIYLHDTPAKGLFSRTVRTFSHGCIRVEHTLTLGARLLGEPPPQAASAGSVPGGAVVVEAAAPQGTEQRLQQLIDQGETESLPLPEPLPVYLIYLTAWVDGAGNLQFRDDVYGRDVPLVDRFNFP